MLLSIFLFVLTQVGALCAGGRASLVYATHNGFPSLLQVRDPITFRGDEVVTRTAFSFSFLSAFVVLSLCVSS